jgi:class 3 adenylate cyclase
VTAPDVRYARSGDRFVAYQVLGDASVDLMAYTNGTMLSLNRDDEPHWSRFDRDLASFSRVIRFDPGGIGLSDPVVGSHGLTADLWMHDALAVMDDLGIERCVHLAVNMGVAPALTLAAEVPERVSGLILINCSPCYVWRDDYTIGFPEELVRSFVDGITEPGADASSAVGADDLELMAPSLAADPAFRRWWREASQRAASPTTARSLIHLSAYADHRPLLPKVDAPVLVLSRDTWLVPHSHGRYMAEHLSNSRFVELDGNDLVPYAGETQSMLAEIEQFLTGKKGVPNADRVLATLLMSDIVQSTESAVASGDRAWTHVLDLHDETMAELMARFNGQILKHTGDGVLASFEGPAHAVACGLAVRDAARELDLSVRIGIHTGEVERRGDDISGVGVHIVARVESLASPGEVWVTRTVTDLVTGSGLKFESRGVHELKGIPDQWQLYAVAD